MVRATCVVMVAWSTCTAARADFMTYVGKPDRSYTWRRVSGGSADGTDNVVEIQMTSQTWRGIEWRHRLFIVRPATIGRTSPAILIIGGGSWRDEPRSDKLRDQPRELRYAHALATATNMPVAVVFQIPYQPMFEELYEDALISRTFAAFLRSGDADWPLLLPMTKAAVRAMDTVEAFAKAEWTLDVTGFVVTGASKRGWTTWLTGAADARVAGIVPMAYDILRLYAQMRHQVESWGRYSEQIHDYADAGLTEQLETEMGKRLVALVDPYVYRKRLTMPKLILLGTNDAYWPLDSLNLYYEDLEGPKSVLYIPNSGHGLDDFNRVVDSTAAFALGVAGRLTLPRLSWEVRDVDTGVMLVMHSDAEPVKVSAWASRAPTRDFRNASWTVQNVSPGPNGYVYELPRPGQGYAAVFGEAVYEIDRHPLFLSTSVRIVSSR